MDIDKSTILRAWKDDDYRQSLPAETRDAIPARPTGPDGTALSDEQLEQAAGGTSPACIASFVASLTVEEAWDD